MRKILYSFFAGFVVGASLLLALSLLREAAPWRQEQLDATRTLDFLIDEWSADRTPVDTVSIAQIRRVLEIPDARIGFIPDTVRKLAQGLDSLYHIPTGVTIAQWILESRWGLSELGVSNYFGHTFAAVKSYMDEPSFVIRRERVMRGDSIVAGRAVSFARYRTIAECFDVHGKYLSGSARYSSAFKQTSSERFARALSKAGYATDPDYALKLIAIMRRHNLGNS